MADCQAAANAIWSYHSQGGGPGAIFDAYCVQANTGKQDAPPAPED